MTKSAAKQTRILVMSSGAIGSLLICDAKMLIKIGYVWKIVMPREIGMSIMPKFIVKKAKFPKRPLKRR